MSALGSVLRTDGSLRYQPLLALGQGGMAEVTLAVSKGPSGFSKLVVLKSMRKELVTDRDSMQLFLAEARLSARLNHANVVQIHEVIDSTQPRIVMEYLEGQTHAAIQRKANESFSTRMQLRVLSAVLSGLHYTHELLDYDGTPLNIVHRDVSPQNVVVTYDGQVKVLDFGIATRDNADENKRGGAIKGKFSYMPREQLLGEPVDRRADIHAVGAMLWHAAAGAMLWDGIEPADAMRRLIDGRIPKPSSIRPVDERLELIIMKALAPEPSDRYATAQELHDEIEGYLASTEPAISLREIGEFVSNLFSSDRNERRDQIRAKLANPSSIPPVIEALPQSGETDGMAALSVVEAAPQPPRRYLLAVVAVAVLLAAAGGIYQYKSASSQPSTPNMVTHADSDGRAWIQVRISVYPPNALLTIDGEAVYENPALLETRVDERDHEVIAKLPGYETVVRRLRFDYDISLDLVLKPSAPPPAASSSAVVDAVPSDADHKGVGAATGSSRRATSNARKPAPRPGQADNCSPPYYFKDGIKKFKPNCL